MKVCEFSLKQLVPVFFKYNGTFHLGDFILTYKNDTAIFPVLKG